MLSKILKSSEPTKEFRIKQKYCDFERLFRKKISFETQNFKFAKKKQNFL